MRKIDLTIMALALARGGPSLSFVPGIDARDA